MGWKLHTHTQKKNQNKTGSNTLRQRRTLGEKNKPKHQGLIENSRTLLRLSKSGTQKHIRVIRKKKLNQAIMTIKLTELKDFIHSSRISLLSLASCLSTGSLVSSMLSHGAEYGYTTSIYQPHSRPTYGHLFFTSVYPSKHCTTVPVSTTVCTIYQTEREEGAATCQDCIFWQDCILTGNVRCTLLKHYI